MHIVRYLDDHDTVRVGVYDDGHVAALPVTSLAELLRHTRAELRTMLEETVPAGPIDTSALLAPIDGRTELWAAGVTYRSSQLARIEESQQATAYQRVYDAPRPELFFKSVAWRTVTDDEPIAIRDDSPLNVPEPEFALAINAHGEIVGYLICNDVSSRTIEGDNPLYLPQAKLYAGAAALSNGIVPAWDLNPHDRTITIAVLRDGQVAFNGETNTAQMHRTFEDLVEYLFRAQSFPDGAILSTGTGIVPEITFSLQPGDIVNIAIDGVGTLINRVVVGKQQFEFLETR